MPTTFMDAITVAYRKVRGRAKDYRYVGAKRYTTLVRKDGVETWRPVEILGPDRRSQTLAEDDAQEWAAKLNLPYIPDLKLGRIYVA